MICFKFFVSYQLIFKNRKYQIEIFRISKIAETLADHLKLSFFIPNKRNFISEITIEETPFFVESRVDIDNERISKQIKFRAEELLIKFRENIIPLNIINYSY